MITARAITTIVFEIISPSGTSTGIYKKCSQEDDPYREGEGLTDLLTMMEPGIARHT